MEKLVLEKQHEIVMPLFGAAYAAPNKGTAYAAPNKGTAILYGFRSALKVGLRSALKVCCLFENSKKKKNQGPTVIL